jgi:molybdate/tungstate transport system ATP-binding protein
MRQRVALGRALAHRPAVLLLDEPLSSLDEATQEQMHGLLAQIHADTGTTILHVTHSRREAERLGQLRLRLAGGRVSPE